MAFINWSQSIGIVINNATSNMTGDILLTLLIVMIVLIAIALMFGIPLELTAIIILPLNLAYMAYYSQYFVGIGILILYISFILTKRFFIFR